MPTAAASPARAGSGAERERAEKAEAAAAAEKRASRREKEELVAAAAAGSVAQEEEGEDVEVEGEEEALAALVVDEDLRACQSLLLLLPHAAFTRGGSDTAAENVRHCNRENHEVVRWDARRKRKQLGI